MLWPVGPRVQECMLPHRLWACPCAGLLSMCMNVPCLGGACGRRVSHPGIGALQASPATLWPIVTIGSFVATSWGHMPRNSIAHAPTCTSCCIILIQKGPSVEHPALLIPQPAPPPSVCRESDVPSPASVMSTRWLWVSWVSCVLTLDSSRSYSCLSPHTHARTP